MRRVDRQNLAQFFEFWMNDIVVIDAGPEILCRLCHALGAFHGGACFIGIAEGDDGFRSLQDSVGMLVCLLAVGKVLHFTRVTGFDPRDES